MREFELLIDKALKGGLTPYDIVPANTQILSKCLGFRCGKLGLEKYKVLSNPIPSTIDMYYNWPFPQVITGEKYNLLIVRDTTNQQDSVYSLSDNYATVGLVFDVDELTFGKGTPMEVADFGEYAFMVNGVIMIYWNPALAAWVPSLATASIPLMRAVCNFKGQAFGGNVVAGTWYDCDETFYLWSKIGSLDFTPDQDNEAGYRRDPFGGEVYHTRRLGNSVIGYSAKGIIQIDPVNAPATTFGFKELHDVGLINRGAMNGNLREHVFVDGDYNVWKIGIGVEVGGMNIATINPKMLGYDRYMKELIGEDIIVNYDPAQGDFYIGNSKKTFLLSGNGLTEINQHPSAVWRRNNVTCMIPDGESADKPYICTELFDMEYKGQKTITSMETDASQVDGAEAGIDYANDLNTWHDEIYKPINDQGIASNTVSGNMFRFRLRFSELFDGMRIGYIKARYKMTDLRGLRGVYAPGIRGQKGD